MSSIIPALRHFNGFLISMNMYFYGKQELTA